MSVSINSIETPRLLLRAPELADAEALMGILWDPEVVEQKQVTLLEAPGGLDLALRNTNDMLLHWECADTAIGVSLRRRPVLPDEVITDSNDVVPKALAWLHER